MMATHYPNSVKTREIYRYNRMNNCLIDVCNTWLFSHCWLMFAPYKYSSVVGWCLKHIIIESWLVDIWNIWLQSHGWLVFGTYNYSIIVGVAYAAGVLFAFLVLTIMNYFLLTSWSTGYLNLVYMISGFGDPVALHCIALHCITWNLELCREPMVATVLVQHRLLGITMQLHTMLGMKIGAHMHPCAYIIGLA